MGAGFWQEYLKWIDEGNVVEPQYTTKELMERAAAEAARALESQRNACLKNLGETDYKLLSDFEYQGDVPKIKALRDEWKRILKSDKLETVPEKQSL